MSAVTPETIQAEVSKGKRYWLVLLMSGPNRIEDESAADELLCRPRSFVTKSADS